MAQARSNTFLILATVAVALLAAFVLWLAFGPSGTTETGGTAETGDITVSPPDDRTAEPISTAGSVPTEPGNTASPSGTTPVGATTAPAGSASNVSAAKRQELIEDPRFIRQADGRSVFRESAEFARHLEESDLEPITDLEAVDAIFGAYIWAFRELPEGGENHEITAGLTGKNPKKLIFIPPDHPRLDAKGNLLDRWETPYFFHKQSESKLEIVSAGPDRRLWSSDDIRLIEDLP